MYYVEEEEEEEEERQFQFVVWINYFTPDGMLHRTVWFQQISRC
jgi:hypothetical protein